MSVICGSKNLFFINTIDINNVLISIVFS